MKKYGFLQMKNIKEGIRFFAENGLVYKEISFIFSSTKTNFSFNCKAIITDEEKEKFILEYCVFSALKLLLLSGYTADAEAAYIILEDKFKELYFHKNKRRQLIMKLDFRTDKTKVDPINSRIVNALGRNNIDTEEELYEWIKHNGFMSLKNIRNLGEESIKIISNQMISECHDLNGAICSMKIVPLSRNPRDILFYRLEITNYAGIELIIFVIFAKYNVKPDDDPFLRISLAYNLHEFINFNFDLCNQFEFDDIIKNLFLKRINN